MPEYAPGCRCPDCRREAGWRRSRGIEDLDSDGVLRSRFYHAIVLYEDPGHPSVESLSGLGERSEDEV